MNNEEAILEYLIEEYGGQPHDKMRIDKSQIAKLDIPESVGAYFLCMLKTKGYIKIHNRSLHDDFSMPWTISLTGDGLCYFEDKAEKERELQKDKNRYKTTTGIAAAALFLSALNTCDLYGRDICMAISWIISFIQNSINMLF